MLRTLWQTRLLSVPHKFMVTQGITVVTVFDLTAHKKSSLVAAASIAALIASYAEVVLIII